MARRHATSLIVPAVETRRDRRARMRDGRQLAGPSARRRAARQNRQAVEKAAREASPALSRAGEPGPAAGGPPAVPCAGPPGDFGHPRRRLPVPRRSRPGRGGCVDRQRRVQPTLVRVRPLGALRTWRYHQPQHCRRRGDRHRKISPAEEPGDPLTVLSPPRLCARGPEGGVDRRRPRGRRFGHRARTWHAGPDQPA